MKKFNCQTSSEDFLIVEELGEYGYQISIINGCKTGGEVTLNYGQIQELIEELQNISK
jgi:hypothetical protein